MLPESWLPPSQGHASCLPALRQAPFPSAMMICGLSFPVRNNPQAHVGKELPGFGALELCFNLLSARYTTKLIFLYAF